MLHSYRDMQAGHSVAESAGGSRGVLMDLDRDCVDTLSVRSLRRGLILVRSVSGSRLNKDHLGFLRIIWAQYGSCGLIRIRCAQYGSCGLNTDQMGSIRIIETNDSFLFLD